MEHVKALTGWPTGDGEMARRIREHDWSATPLGPLVEWPQSLRMMVDLMLSMPLPATVLWGPEHVQLYNDPYVPIARDRHPTLLGRPVAEGWADAYQAVIAPLLDASQAGRATRLVDFPVLLRNAEGGAEERFFDTDWCPIRDESGAVAGALQTLTEVTARHTTAQALRSSEEEYRSLFESMDEAYAVVEILKGEDGRWSDFRFLNANPAFREHTSMPDPVGKTASELLGSPNPRWTELYGQVLETGEAIRVEETEHTLGRTFDLNIFPLDRSRNRVAVLFTDVTARKQAEAALRESEERQRFLLRLSDATRSLVDAAEIQATTARLLGEHLRVDRSMYAEVDGERGFETGIIRGQYVRPTQTGEPSSFPFPECFTYESYGAHTMAARYRGEPLIVSDVLSDPAFSDKDREAWTAAGVRAAVVATLAKGGRLLAELGVHCTGPRSWTDAEVALVQEVAERTWAAAERARAEAALRASEEKYRSLFQTMGQGYSDLELIRNADGRVVNYRYLALNPAYERLTGMRVADAVGRTARESLPELETWWEETFEQIVERGEPERLEHQVASLNRWYEVFVYPRGGDRLSVLYEDNSDRKRAELALRESEARQAFLLALGDAMRLLPEATGKIEIAARLLGERLGADRILYAEYDWQRNVADIFNGWFADGAEPFPTLMQLEAYEGEVLSDLKKGRAVRVDNVGLLAEEPAYAAIASVGVQALLSIPLLVDGTLKVNLSVHQHKPREWTDSEVLLVKDVAERLWPEVIRARAEEALRESERRMRSLMEGVPQLVWRAARKGEWTWASPQWTAYTGQDGPESHGQGWLQALHPDDRQAALHAWDHAAEHGFEVEYRIRRADGVHRWFTTRATPVRDEAGEIVEWLGTSTDIHDLRELQERQRVLVAELQHRTRNLMGVVRSTADKTARASADLSDFRTRFRDRLDALARVQGLLSRLNEHDRVTFDELVRAELSAMGEAGDRVQIEGPSGVRLRSSTVQTLAMALYELATNALKYGALSVASGRLAIRWTLERAGEGGAPLLHIDWRETGVPIPEETHPRRGQGRELIERALPYQLDAITSYTLGRDGVHCTITVPVSATNLEAEHHA